MSLKDKKKNLIQKLKAKNYAVENESVDTITFLSVLSLSDKSVN